jgi:hypothetical protein
MSASHLTSTASTASTASTESAPAAPPAREAPSAGWARAGALVLLLTLGLALLLVAFGWPAVRSGPHDVPLGVSGPAPLAAQVTQRLDRAAPGAFSVTAYGDEAALRRAILNRDAYGGIVLSPSGPRVLTAGAAGPAVASALSTLAGGLATQPGAAPATQDVVPLPAEDPRGAGLAAATLPISLGGVLPAVVLAAAYRRRPGVRLAAAVALALTTGSTLAAVLRFWFGTVPSHYWSVALALSLTLAAISLGLLGLQAVAGRLGLGIGAVVVLLLGNPLSGLTSAPELLPRGWGALGQLLPPGAGGTLLRSTGYFDGAAAGRPVVVLTCWAALGLGLYAVAAARRPRQDG